MRVITLKPTLFIIHDVKHSGGIKYEIADRDSRENETGKGELTTWNTTRTIDDKAAFDAARATRSRIETLMKSETKAAVSDITGGLFAPDSPETWTALETAQAKIAEELEAYRRDYDSGNRLTSRVIVFKIAGENRALLEALSEQISDGLDNLRAAVNAADVTRIRAALKSIKGMDAVLTPRAAAALDVMMKTYRDKAREITAAVNKQGKTLDEIRQQMDASPIDAASLAIFGDAPELDAATLPTMDAADFQTEAPETADTSAPALDTATLDMTDAGDLDTTPAAAAAIDQTPEARPADDWQDAEPVSPPAAAPAPGAPADDPDAQDAAAALAELKRERRAERAAV